MTILPTCCIRKNRALCSSLKVIRLVILPDVLVSVIRLCLIIRDVTLFQFGIVFSFASSRPLALIVCKRMVNYKTAVEVPVVFYFFRSVIYISAMSVRLGRTDKKRHNITSVVCRRYLCRFQCSQKAVMKHRQIFSQNTKGYTLVNLSHKYSITY